MGTAWGQPRLTWQAWDYDNTEVRSTLRLAWPHCLTSDELTAHVCLLCIWRAGRTELCQCQSASLSSLYLSQGEEISPVLVFLLLTSPALPYSFQSRCSGQNYLRTEAIIIIDKIYKRCEVRSDGAAVPEMFSTRKSVRS